MKAGTYKVVVTGATEKWYDANGNKIYNKNYKDLEEWREYDGNGNHIHYKNSDGYEYWNEYDSNGKLIYTKNSNGYEQWREYDAHGKITHYKDSDGYEQWYDSKGNQITKEEYDRIHSTCHGKVVEIEGKKYQLKAI